MYSFHHVSLSVSDLEKSKAFYERFGFREVARYSDPDRRFEIVHLQIDQVLLELFCFAGSTPVPASAKDLATDLPINGVKHFALEVESVENALEQLQKEGIANGVSIHEGKTGVRYFFIKDPDEILVEILEDKRQL